MLKRNDPNHSTGENRIGARGLALIIASALFMEQLDSTILATALPTMARSFHVDAVSLNVTITAYLLGLALFIPASGQVADRFGSRFVFRCAIVIFTIGSALCGLANNLPLLAFFRFVQGMGGAMMVPVGRQLLLRSIPKSELITANSWLLVPGLLGPVVGPPIGGVISTYANWHWIFWVNVPIGILGFGLVTFLVGDVREPDPKPFDFSGLALSGTSLSLILCGLEIATQHLLSLTFAAAAIATGLLFAGLYVFYARRSAHPVLDLRLFSIPTFRTSMVAGALFRFGGGGLPFLLPLLFQLGFGYSAAQSGAVTFISAAGTMLMKSMTVHFLRRWGFRQVMTWNLFICAALLLACGFFRPSWPAVAIYAVLFIGGLFRSLQYNAYGSLCYADVTRDEISSATTFNLTAQQVTATLGIAIAAVVLNEATLLSGHARPELSDFSIVFVVLTVLSLLPLRSIRALDDNAGSELTGRNRAPPATMRRAKATSA